MRADSTTQVQASRNVAFALFLIYYFTLCDFCLKFLPVDLAIPLRYLPEAALYLYVLTLLLKDWRLFDFPLTRPLLLCALSMSVSVALNSGSEIAALTDFRLFFRFAAFTFIGWRTPLTEGRVEQFLRGFVPLILIELVVGALEFVGGEQTQMFFSPVLGLTSGAAGVSLNQVFGEHGWIFGTLSNYNHYGMFMTTSCVVAIAMYLTWRSASSLWLACACALAVVLSFSRHSLLLLLVAVGCVLLVRQGRISVGRALRVFAGVLVLVVALITAANRFVPGFGDRLQTIVAPEVIEGDPAANIRLYMTLALPPRFIEVHPFFGQGPIDPADAVGFGDEDPSLGPPLKAVPELPPIATFYLGDVVWVMVLGLYGCFGLASFAYVLWTIGRIANRVRTQTTSIHFQALAQACLALILVFLLSGFFSEEIFARECIPPFWFISGLVLSLGARDPVEQ